MLSDAIFSLGARAYPLVHRSNPGYDNSGRAIVSMTSPDTVMGLMQPVSGKTIERLPEGLTEGEVRAFWTIAALVTADSDANTKGDLVTADGIQWEVVMEESWGSFGNYHKYILSRTS